MKYLLLFSLTALTCLTGQAFGQLHLSGDLSALGNSSVIIQYYEGDTKKSDTQKVTDGKFTWEAPITETQKITMIFPGRAIYFFAEPGTMTITGSRDALDRLNITGSKTNDEAVEYARLMKPIEEEEHILFPQYGKLSEDKELVLEDKIADLVKQRNTIANNYIASHPQSAFSLSLISEYSRLGTYEVVAPMYGKLGKKMKVTSGGKHIADRLDQLKRSAVGEKMKDFTENDTSGNSVSLANLKGKYVLVDFWASWCAPCRGEIPILIKTYTKFKDKNFTVLSISLDDHKKLWEDAMAMLKMPWTQVSNLKGWDDELAVYYGLRGIPSTLLLDPDGKIIARDLRGLTLSKKLQELFM